ncbi:hypothetical protein [Burkholderia multivorans]|uniref:hypothetical protein n=1 Tax=Burkholderia multivorans TaxID=87883 RepID=UPI002018AB0F|nr:hypothetical protein [Burkholderia multivorans]UQN71764.1 hypothetical protein L0Z45_26190 [Burkholderia multivorans]UQN77500.1 hypothetical protein L0Z11_26220 [Burkholderia multivorans]
MTDLRENLRIAVDALIGEGRKFASGRELAQRAHTLGLVESAESFARTVNRVRSGDKDVQLSTVDILAKTAGKSVVDLIGRDTAALSVTQQSAMPRSWDNLSAEALALVDAIANADAAGLSPEVFRSIKNLLITIAFAEPSKGDDKLPHFQP